MLVQSNLKGRGHLIFPALATACGVNSPPLACPEPGSESILVWILILLPAQMMNCQSMSILGVLLFFFFICIYIVPSQFSLFLAWKPFHTPISHVAMLQFLLRFWKERNQNFTIQSVSKA